MGRWSDAYGRKPFLVICYSFACLPVLILTLHMQYDVSLYFYFPASVRALLLLYCPTQPLLHCCTQTPHRLHADCICGVVCLTAQFVVASLAAVCPTHLLYTCST